MKIAVCGTSKDGTDNEILKGAKEIGKEIAKKGRTLIFGGCLGYPYAAAKGAFENNGEVIGISPAKDEDEHVNVYGFPVDNISKMEYTGLGIPGRNFPIIQMSDAVIIISGQIGTLNEFSIAFQQKKPMGILKGSKGITEILDKVIDICDNERYDMKGRVVFSDDPKEVVSRLINK